MGAAGIEWVMILHFYIAISSSTKPSQLPAFVQIPILLSEVCCHGVKFVGMAKRETLCESTGRIRLYLLLGTSQVVGSAMPLSLNGCLRLTKAGSCVDRLAKLGIWHMPLPIESYKLTPDRIFHKCLGWVELGRVSGLKLLRSRSSSHTIFRMKRRQEAGSYSEFELRIMHIKVSL